MNILNIENISKIYGEKVIFDQASFGIQEGDKIGIIGINGTGKTTLLRMVAGLEQPDEGQIVKQNNLRIAYLPVSYTHLDVYKRQSRHWRWGLLQNTYPCGCKEHRQEEKESKKWLRVKGQNSLQKIF